MNTNTVHSSAPVDSDTGHPTHSSLADVLGRAATASIVISTMVVGITLLASLVLGDAMSIPSVITVDTVDRGTAMSTDVSLNLPGLVALMAITFLVVGGLMWLATLVRRRGVGHV